MEKHTYKKADHGDLGLLTELRVEVLRAANRLPETTDMEAVRQTSVAYYRNSLSDDSHVTFLVYDHEESVLGCGGISFYQVLPTYHNPSGRKAYIMNIYTRPGSRKQGVGKTVLNLLVEEARHRGITQIGLETTDMGRSLYLNNGFVPCLSELEFRGL